MGLAWIAIIALGTVSVSPEPDAAGNRIESLSVVQSANTGREPAAHCTADRRWCAQLRAGDGGAWRLHVFQGAPEPGSISDRRPHALGEMEERDTVRLWSHVVREAGGAVLVGVEHHRSAGFSGGGASAIRLGLFRAEPASPDIREVLDVPLNAGLDIRACFSEQHVRDRRDACSDQYDFGAALTLDPATRAGRPRFVLTTRASTFPGRRSRFEDSSEAPPLRRSDLVRWTDPICSYRRSFAWNESAGRYEPDSPLPECNEYFDF